MDPAKLEHLKKLVKPARTIYLVQRGRTRRGGEYVSAFVIVKAEGFAPFVKCIDREIADTLPLDVPYDEKRDGFYLKHGQTAAARIIVPISNAVFGLAEGCESEWL